MMEIINISKNLLQENELEIRWQNFLFYYNEMSISLINVQGTEIPQILDKISGYVSSGEYWFISYNFSRSSEIVRRKHEE